VYAGLYMGISLSDGNQFGTRNPSISSRTTNTQGTSTQTLLQVHFSLYCTLHYLTATKCILILTTYMYKDTSDLFEMKKKHALIFPTSRFFMTPLISAPLKVIAVAADWRLSVIIVSGESGMLKFSQDLG
jgi:hypothetical protein